MEPQEEILKLIKERLKVKVPDNILEVPPDPKFGDFALPCFTFAKEKKKNPNEIAKEFSLLLNQDLPSVNLASTTAMGPYVNFFLKKDNLAKKVISKILKEKDQYGSMKKKQRNSLGGITRS